MRETIKKDEKAIQHVTVFSETRDKHGTKIQKILKENWLIG